MIDRIYNYMTANSMIEEGGRILAAVSGGADSMCLLEALRELQPRTGLQLKVFHVHHGLRESAAGDLDYVAEYCEQADIPFEAAYVDAAGFAGGHGLSVEEAARQLRYEALEKAADQWDQENLSEKEHLPEHKTLASGQNGKCRIAVAHHMEDQAETVLFNLIRGSRLTGLRGMLPVSGRIIRPLLTCSRREIEEFLAARGISWREDETNEDVRYSRNLLRRRIIPLLEQINKGAQEHIVRASEEAAEAEEFLRAETEKAAEKCRIQGESIDIVSIPNLLQYPPLIRRRVVYGVIADLAGRKKDLRDKHVQAVLQLAQKNGNGQLDVFGGVRVEKAYDRLLFYAGNTADAAASHAGNTANEAAGSPVTLTGRAPEDSHSELPSPAFAYSRRWPMSAAEYECRVLDFDGDMAAVSRKQCTKWFDYDKIGALPSFRTRRGGDRITLDESGRSKTIARYMIDAKVPAQLRDRIVLPTIGGEILWIPAGVADAPDSDNGNSSDSGRISAAYMVSDHTSRILEIRWKAGSRTPAGSFDNMDTGINNN
ncbi:MAG: tRNA lysidine(34) synthetase TilS [Lachnospiraceae bacterium]|nr:tRNA lysidine(34) synthetase TilS [Lachnospiraceae bacterium]